MIEFSNHATDSVSSSNNSDQTPAPPYSAHCVDSRWLNVLRVGLRHTPKLLETRVADKVTGTLPLAFLESRLFGRFLISLPYLNTAGVTADDEATAKNLVEQAVQLADELDVRYLELRHEVAVEHARLIGRNETKRHLRLPLPDTSDALWRQLHSKVRNQVRKGQKQGLTVHWGGGELLDQWYEVFSHNMRDLGTPAYGRSFFAALLASFPSEAELCVLRLAERPIAAALLMHSSRKTEVPSAGSLKRYNATNANMVMYWQLLVRAIGRGSRVFDFGRSTIDSNTYRFKRQWGAVPHPAIWQYYVRRGELSDMRPENSRYGLAIRIWKRLPVALTRTIGPMIVRGIP